MRLQVLDPREHPDFLDLALEAPLASWKGPRVVDLSDGMHRHVVRYVDYEEKLYVLKELPAALAEREFRLLRELRSRGLPVVDVVGVVSDRGPAAGGEDLLITRHLDFSLPYRILFTQRRIPYLRDRLRDAMAGLLVRIHLTGFFWGDCSLSNTLFRRDAGALSAYVVDTETGELHERLSDGQRRTDILIAVENLAGGLTDLQAAGQIAPDVDTIELADQMAERYHRLWAELTEAEVFEADETYRIDARIRRLNDLGFDVEELELTTTPDGERVRLVPKVVELGYHSVRLANLTGLQTEENQARRILNEIARFRLRIEGEKGRRLPDGLVAARWLDREFEPIIGAIPDELRGKLEPAEMYHQILEHRWYLSEKQGSDVGPARAVAAYTDSVLRHAPDERVVPDPGDEPDDD